MCGIAGIFAYHYAALPVDRDELRAMRDHMTARGPDGKGEWFSEDVRVGIGHRRLSIIDLSERAAQPMLSADGSLVITFNGEVYNYRALRERLVAAGHRFRTESDTEVLLHLYEVRGERMLDDMRGMFAFAIWDSRKKALLLARDPYGIKPLYYSNDGWTLRFASQVKALLTSPRVSRQAEPAGVAGFYLFGSVPEPYTLYQEIRSVPAGSCQWVSATGPAPAARYFSLARAWEGLGRRPQCSPGELQRTVRTALLDSVRHHLVSDVPVGAFLSAGIDSGTLVGLMKDVGQSDIHTVTLGFKDFEGTRDDESQLAARTAAWHGVRHTIRMVTEAEFREDLPRILAAMDQPSVDGVNTWFVSKAAHECGLKVAVSGVGGDELFGGYTLFRDIPRWTRLLWLPARVPGLGVFVEQAVQAFRPLFPSVHPKAAGLLRYGGSYHGAWLLRRGLYLPGELPALLGDELAREGLRRLTPLDHVRQPLDSAHAKPGHGDRRRLTAFARVAVLDAQFYLSNVLLRDTDWASMAHSLEVRTPLVDRTLLETLGPVLADNRGNLKPLLAQSASRPLERETLERTKTGFSTPVAAWQRRLPQLAPQPGHGGTADDVRWARRWCRSVAAMAASHGAWPA